MRGGAGGNDIIDHNNMSDMLFMKTDSALEAMYDALDMDEKNYEERFKSNFKSYYRPEIGFVRKSANYLKTEPEELLHEKSGLNRSHFNPENDYTHTDLEMKITSIIAPLRNIPEVRFHSQDGVSLQLIRYDRETKCFALCPDALKV
jgi:hypothetical protein